MPRIAHCIVLTLAGMSAVAQNLEERIATLLEAPAARRATWGIHAVEASTGRVLYSRNAGVPVTPASNTKLFSTALGLLKLGKDYRFETRVLAVARPQNGRIRGDLRLVGGGDPTLSARAVPYTKGPIEGDPLKPLAELADQVAAAGVRVVEGDLIGDDTHWPWAPYPDGWAVGDMVWEYGAPVSALTLNDNALSLTIRPGKKAGEAAEAMLRPAVEYYTIHNTLRTVEGAERRITVDREPGSKVLEIGGTAPPNGGAASQLIAVDDPALFAAQAFAQLLRARGVTLLGTVRAAHRMPQQPYLEPEGVELAKRVSPPLIEILRVIDKVSQNLHAEMVLREVGMKTRGKGTVEAAQKELAEVLAAAGASKEEFDFEDGSGLSRRTLVSPAAITSLLRYMYTNGSGEGYWSLLPVAGEDGTLASRFKEFPQAGAIRAKTGSLSHVAALSGYAGLDPARRIAFSIVANGATAPASAVRTVIDKIAVAILEEGTR